MVKQRTLGTAVSALVLSAVLALTAMVSGGANEPALFTGCVPYVPSAAPTTAPTAAPTAVPTITPTVLPTTSPTTAPSTMIVGLDMGAWNVPAEAKAAVNFVTVATPNGGGEAANLASYANGGLGVIEVRVGPYNSGGVAALNPSTWANSAVAAYRANPGIIAIEILNEPGGSWFWGSGALSQTNATAYARLLKTVRAAFDANGSRPKLIASFDGGYAGGSTWGAMVKIGDPLAWSYVDGVTVHPYGGTSNRAASALGHRDNVANARSATGLPVWVTEVGWPTAAGQPSTGDSFQWTEAEQAANITNFVNWAKAQGYVAAVTYFMYQDYGSNSWYGITRIGGAHKPSFAALAALR